MTALAHHVEFTLASMIYGGQCAKIPDPRGTFFEAKSVVRCEAQCSDITVYLYNTQMHICHTSTITLNGE